MVFSGIDLIALERSKQNSKKNIHILYLITPPELRFMFRAVNSIIEYILKDYVKKMWSSALKTYLQRSVMWEVNWIEIHVRNLLLRSPKILCIIKYIQLLQDLKNVMNDCFRIKLKLKEECNEKLKKII